MTAPGAEQTLTRTQVKRRYVRRTRSAGAALLPYGVIPALGLVCLTLFALFPFASNWIERPAEESARIALNAAGETWAEVRASGQWITLEGEAPSPERAAQAVRLVREAKGRTLFGLARPVTRVNDRISVGPASAAPTETAPQPDVSPFLEAPEETAQDGGQDENGLAVCNQGLAGLLSETKFAFASSSAVPGRQNDPLVDQLAEMIAGCSGNILIDGHTDATGSASGNDALSLARAEAVGEALIMRGIPPARIEARGFGAARPLVGNATPEDRARNRRIEIRMRLSDAD